MKDKLPLLQALIDYHSENNILYSMPGNKAGDAFNRDEIGKFLADNLGYMDITEVDPLDNLHHPDGVIKKSQELLAEFYGVKKAYFLVNGTTGGNLASIFAAFKEGDEVIVERNCHKSIYNALILRKLKVTYIESNVQEISGLFLPPDSKKIYDALAKSPEAKGIVLTYPNYFGITYDLKDIIKDLKKKNLKVIVDEAHGAHFGVSKRLPENLAKLADYTIVSSHKTLPALTGGSYLLCNDLESDIDFYVSAFMTTSPSYLIMASLDYARYYLQEYGEEDYNNLIDLAEDMKKKINSLNKVKVLDYNSLERGYSIDLSRYVLVLPSGYSGSKLLEYLRKNNIQCEMSFLSGVVLILSPYDAKRNLEKLYEVLSKMNMELLRDDIKNVGFNEISLQKSLEPYDVFGYEYEEIEVDDGAIGKVLKEAIIPYPPGIPIASPGEVINKEFVKVLLEYIKLDNTVIGINNKRIKVIKNR